MKKAVEKMGVVPDLILVDGKFKIPDLPIKQRAIISGDKLEFPISAASILAKTFRDDLMRNLAEKYPGYGFERHMGYPTKEHIANLKRLGPCPIHRKSFRPVSLLMNGLDR